MKCSLGISNFLEEISSLSHSVVFLYFFALIAALISFLSNSLSALRSPPVLCCDTDNGAGLLRWKNLPASAGDVRDASWIPWRRTWWPTPLFLPGESCGQEPGGLQSMGSQRVGHDWSEWARKQTIGPRRKCFPVCQFSNESLFLTALINISVLPQMNSVQC